MKKDIYGIKVAGNGVARGKGAAEEMESLGLEDRMKNRESLQQGNVTQAQILSI